MTCGSLLSDAYSLFIVVMCQIEKFLMGYLLLCQLEIVWLLLEQVAVVRFFMSPNTIESINSFALLVLFKAVDGANFSSVSCLVFCYILVYLFNREINIWIRVWLHIHSRHKEREKKLLYIVVNWKFIGSFSTSLRYFAPYFTHIQMSWCINGFIYAGKSTILRMLFRFFDTHSGNVSSYFLLLYWYISFCTFILDIQRA